MRSADWHCGTQYPDIEKARRMCKTPHTSMLANSSRCEIHQLIHVLHHIFSHINRQTQDRCNNFYFKDTQRFFLLQIWSSQLTFFCVLSCFSHFMHLKTRVIGPLLASYLCQNFQIGIPRFSFFLLFLSLLSFESLWIASWHDWFYPYFTCDA